MMQQTGVSGVVVHLSAHGSAAYAGELSSDIVARADQRGVCSGQNLGAEVLRVSEPAVWHGFHLGDADESVWTER